MDASFPPAFRQAAALSDSIAQALGLETRDAVLRFLRCLAIGPVEDAPFSTIVSDTGSPFEFSFSGRQEPACVRLLGEATEPGESILSRCLRGIDSALNVAAAFGLGGERDRVAGTLEALMPPGEYLAQLHWAAAVWLALRTDGPRNACRVYVNLQWGTVGPRLARVADCLGILGADCAREQLGALIPLLGGWSSPVGLSLDLLPGEFRPARLHLDPGRLPAHRLMALVRHCGAEPRRQEVFDFLELFEPFPASGPKPFLLSVGLGGSEARSLKLDATLRAMPGMTGARARGLLEGAEAIAGRAGAYHRVERLFARPGDERGMQYLGLTVGPIGDPYLNVYLSPPPCPHRPEPGGRGTAPGARPGTDGCLRAGIDFLLSAAPGGGIPMDARAKLSERRCIPPGWCDVYATALVAQEGRPLLPALPASFLDGLTRFLAGAASEGGWRYLPDLPADADDTAMALSALLEDGHAVAEPRVRRLLEAQAADGGFVTFFGSAAQASHPAVTLNVVRALGWGRVAWESCPTADYLQRWIQDPGFPACAWSHSPFFPLFLLARTDEVHRWLGDMVRAAIIGRLTALRGPNDLWGKGHPEAVDTALAVLCHEALGLKVESGATVAAFLRSHQLGDGGWGWCPLFSDGSGTWFGHRAVSTLLALRAIRFLEAS